MYSTLASLGKMNNRIEVGVKYPTKGTQKETYNTRDILLSIVSLVLFQLEHLFKENSGSHG